MSRIQDLRQRAGAELFRSSIPGNWPAQVEMPFPLRNCLGLHLMPTTGESAISLHPGHEVWGVSRSAPRCVPSKSVTRASLGVDSCGSRVVQPPEWRISARVGREPAFTVTAAMPTGASQCRFVIPCRGSGERVGGPLLCGGITVYNPMRTMASILSRVGVVGIGGLGHLAFSLPGLRR